MMKRLIVNADDFGLTRGVNDGIARAFRSGIVTSATIMANGKAFDHAVEHARANRGLGVGCHLALVGGSPVSLPARIPSLINKDGLLPATLTELVVRLSRGLISTDAIVTELRAQVERAVNAGITPTHFDSHKHSHTHPVVMEALALVAGEFGIKRVRNPFERVFSSTPLRSWSNWSYMKQSALSVAIAPSAIRFKMLVRDYGLRTPDRFVGV